MLGDEAGEIAGVDPTSQVVTGSVKFSVYLGDL